MGGSQKSKRVTWPSDDNLCQVRLFLSEDSPAQVGFGSQDHLQAKTWPSHSNFLVSDENLPPGFEGTQPSNVQWNKLPQIPLIKWRCPSRFLLDESWRVAAGEESVEFERENNRVKRVLEAIYPRESAIPPNPSDGVGLEDSSPNDKLPILIPITPIEDEDAPPSADGFVDSAMAMANASSLSLQAQTAAASLASSSRYAPAANPATQGGGVPAVESIPGLDPAVVSAANAALSAIMTTNNNQGNLIDRDLLIKILSDPKMVEQLFKNHGGAASGSPQIPPAGSDQNLPSMSTHSLQDTKVYSMASSTTTHNMAPVTGMQNRLRPMTPGISFSEPPAPGGPVGRTTAHVNRSEFVPGPLTTSSSGGVFYPPPPARIGAIPNPPPPSQTVTKDINYYKSLIQQHGGDRQETTMTQYGGGSRSNHHLAAAPVREAASNIGRSRDLKPKIMKPCMYFNTARGCRNGANCAYQHDESAQQRMGGLPESQSAKRMKMDREITGT